VRLVTRLATLSLDRNMLEREWSLQAAMALEAHSVLAEFGT
jgi:hypothetical protein